ncbi:MAG: hypothetical protein QM757_38100 [Paludibaculum sp.]
MGCTVRRLGLWLEQMGQIVPAGWGGLDGGLNPAEAHLDPTGVTVEGLDEAVLAENPCACNLFVAAGVFQAGIE